MIIDLDKVFAVTKPQQITLHFDRKDYNLKRLSVADVASFEELGKPADGEAVQGTDQRVIDVARSWFPGEAPPQLCVQLKELADDENATAAQKRNDAMRDASILISVITELFTQQNSAVKLGALARQEVAEQVAAARAEVAAATRNSSSY